MKRVPIIVPILLLLAACGTTQAQSPNASQPAQGSQPAGQSQAPSSGGGGGSGGKALAAAAAAITDWCTVMPANLAAQLVPGASDPVSGQYPSSCTVTNGTQALQVSYQPGSSAAPGSDATTVPNLGEAAWFPKGNPVDDAYLTVILYTDPNQLGSATFTVEMAGHDGVDHTNDAIAVARAVMDALK